MLEGPNETILFEGYFKKISNKMKHLHELSCLITKAKIK
jgi:hypothetical protein